MTPILSLENDSQMDEFIKYPPKSKRAAQETYKRVGVAKDLDTTSRYVSGSVFKYADIDILIYRLNFVLGSVLN